MAIGDIIGTINFLDFDLYGGAQPKIIHVAGATYAIAYQGYGNDGYVKTIPIQDDGTLGAVKSLEFDTSNGRVPWIIHIAGTVYAIAYIGSGSDGTLKTLHIAADGTIGPVIHTFIFDAGAIVSPVIVHIGGTTYAIFYGLAAGDGWVRTITIQDDGTITGLISSLMFDTPRALYSDPIHISGDVWAIAYTGPGTPAAGTLMSFTITGAGAISVISSYVYDPWQSTNPDLFHIYGDVYGIAFGGPGFDGWLKTTIIYSDGTFGGSILDSLEFDIFYCTDVWVTFIALNVWCLAYEGPDGDGWMRTIRIEDTGLISGEVASFEFDTDVGRYPSMTHVSDDTYALSYLGPGNDGWLKSVRITSSPPPLIRNKAYALAREEL